ncbi:MAG TPA: metallophosphoesterase [Bryobacteraceae bacterium]|nr:metallophosphoesterase [Bryobacteraceae bacterium]
MRRSISFLILLVVAAAAADLKLPLKPKSVRFAVIGDSGTGEKPQYEIAGQLADFHATFPFDFVIMLGDNMYGGERPADFKRKFEDPYKLILDAGVKFYASLGNHDDPNQRFYKPFNMDGKRYYTFRRGDVQLFALDSNYMDPTELDWLDKQLTASDAGWKICFFHHPLYSHGKMHGSDVDLRSQLEPIFGSKGVEVVFSGHDHDYERLKPQKGITYFVLGNSGQLRAGGLNPSPDTAKGFDTDRTFGLVEVSGDNLYFQVVARSGETVDSGTIQKRTAHSAAAAAAP